MSIKQARGTVPDKLLPDATILAASAELATGRRLIREGPVRLDDAFDWPGHPMFQIASLHGH